MVILLNSLIIGLLSINMGLNKGIGLFGGLYNATTVGNTFHVFIFLICFIILNLTSFYPRKIWAEKKYHGVIKYIYPELNSQILNKGSEQFRIIEYPLILLFIITGAIFLISSCDIISIFLSIELQSYGLYLLSTLYRNSELSTSAGLMYFLLGGLSSCFILLGTGLLYVNSGTTNLESLYIISNISDIKYNNILYSYNSNYINYSLLIMSIGFLFKVSAAPFHFWSPDVYDAIPTVVTTFVAIIPKISIFVFLFEIVNYTINYYHTYNFNWTISLLISSLLSLVIGTVLGLNQYKIKKLFAYSTISHIGFILLSLSINSIESIQSFIFYLIQYTISNLNLFIILATIGYILYYGANKEKKNKNIMDKNNSPIQLISQLKGFFFINPLISISFAITIYSLIGIPPLMGFFGKKMVLSAALDNGYVFIVLVAILTSVISAVYYLNIIKEIFFEGPDYKLHALIYGSRQFKVSNTENSLTYTRYYYQYIREKECIGISTISSSLSISISILTLIILLFIINPEELLSIANLLAILTFNT